VSGKAPTVNEGQFASVTLANASWLVGWLTPWLTAVRIPLLAFILGAVARESFWWVLGGIAVILVTPTPAREWLLIPLGLATYFLSSHILFACFLVGLALTPYLDTQADYLHVKSQVEALTSDLLSSQSHYVIEEQALPPSFWEKFRLYSRKQQTINYLKRLRSKAGFSSTEAVRIFRFGFSGEEKATGAAAAFPISVYSNLVFVRGTLDELNDAQRFQLYHELGHGTDEGVRMFVRGLRWQVLRQFETPIHFGLAVLCAVGTQTWYRWVALAFLFAALWLRSIGANFTMRVSSAASEILADSLALTHTDFFEEGKWKERAENLALRLEDEGSLLTRSDPRAFMVFMRANWLRKWLKVGEVQAVVPYDIDPRLHLAFPLYLLSGFYSHLPDFRHAAIMFWVVFATVAVAAVRRFIFIMRIQDLVAKLDSALTVKLTKRESSLATAPGMVCS